MLKGQAVTRMTSVQVMSAMSVGPDCNKKYAKIQEGIETTISADGRARISRILADIKHLSDVEKLLLYLKLPTGISQDDHLRLTPPPCLHTANRKEQAEAFTWIRSHLEEHGDVCMPKAEVYDEYRQYCESHELRPLCNADFGKMMKQVFPDINTRRLGQRGQSKYFYGGLRKKTDHAPPTLPELEIHTKTLEMDSSSLDNEIFKASCLLLCEWADKLLDNKFTSVQSIAEHLVTNLYVNTKSVAAFTLIAAMQESGNSNLKGSALFNSQQSTLGDRHKETNLLLQQKLQKNKLLQKQKEKLQAMKEEMEQQNGGQVVLPSDRKTPNVTGSLRKSVTPSRMSKTPKLASPSPSHISTQSPHKNQSKQEKNMAAAENFDKLVSQTGSGKLIETTTNQQTSRQSMETGISRQVSHIKSNVNKNIELSKVYSEDNDSVFSFPENTQQQSDTEIPRRRTVSDTCGNEDSDIEMLDLTGPLEKAQETETQAQTPSMEMETNQNSSSHVRKINFDNVREAQTTNMSCENKQRINQNSSASNKQNTTTESDVYKDTKSDDNLSKSDGHVSLKMLLERKDNEKASLNKSLGVLEKSKNTLYVNQSTVSGRSAFVPFSQVQNRKDNITVNQTVSQTGIPIFIPSSSDNQSTNVAMIAVPSNVVSGSQQTSTSRVPDNIIKLLSVPCSTSFQLQSTDCEGAQQKFFIQSQDVSIVTDSQMSDSSAPCLTKDTQTLVTTSAVLSKSSSCDSIVSVSPSINSTNISKHARTRFTPIRPKASPNKIQPAKESKGENPTYDKRPVSEILKEKRAKEQAEAFAKFQQGMRLPTIPMQPSLVIGRNNLNQTQAISNSGSPKEVVIIVNNQAGGSGMQTVMAPSMFVTQSVVSKETMGCRQSIEGSISLQKQSGQSVGVHTEGGQAFSEITASQEKKEEKGLQERLSLEEKENKLEKHQEIPITDSDKESEYLDKVEQMWTETPAKIAKLNITSPYRPESACSLGRDTPVKIMKASDSCSSRPESACSFGRETPSGARKRKSSDYAQRRDFKRLNSTGDEGEDMFNMKLQSEILSSEMEAKFGQNPRRTRSCTYELDKDVCVPVTALLTEGLQSPDITSLEREALLESGFPNSILSGNLHKIHAQTSSVGVNAKALRQSQQKLIKNKTDLDMRVKNFLQKDERFNFQMQSDKNINDVRLPRPKTSQDNLIIKDSGKSLKKVDEQVGGIVQQLGVDMETNSAYMEPSGLPSEVADWINDTIEKRQLQNQSALSEPDMSTCSQKSNLVTELGLSGFKFEVGQPVSAKPENSVPESTRSKSRGNSKTEESPFMVPKVPTYSLRTKDTTARGAPEFYGKSTRCQSLPSFSSPNPSPISPVAPQLTRHTLCRAMSMSPRNPQTDTIQREVNVITSPTQRHETSDTHSLSLSIHAGTKFRDETSPKPANRLGSIEDAKSLQSQTGSYLASMQHTLQKPGDNLDMHLGKPRENEPTGFFTNSQSVTFAGISQNVSGKDTTSYMERSVCNVQERFVSKTPFSDSGYHSTGPSPILNSTPVSSLMDLEVANAQYATKGPTEIQELSSDLTQQAIIQSPNQNPGLEMHVSSSTAGVLQSVSLTSPTNSAFIPIQGSNQDTLYVTPIKPTVTLPNAGNLDNTLAYSGNLYIEPNSDEITEQAMMISPKSHDPPSYETAIKSLRKTGHPMENTAFQDNNITGNTPNSSLPINKASIEHKEVLYEIHRHLEPSCSQPAQGFHKTNFSSTQSAPFQDILESPTDVSSKDSGSQERISLLANMGNTVENDKNKGMYGPFASKLVQLSRQTKQKPQTTKQQTTTGFKPTSSLIKPASLKSITETGELLKGSGDMPSMNNIPAIDTQGTSNVYTMNNLNPSSSIINNLSPNLSKTINQSEGAISSLPFPSQSDLDFISTSHFTSPANEQLSKTGPSIQLSEHSIHNNISNQPSMLMQYANLSPHNNDHLSNQQMMFNFSSDQPDQSTYHNFENVNVNELGMKNLPKDTSSSEGVFQDIGLTLDALKELDGQYLVEESDMYNPTDEGIQQIGDFPMFED